MTAGNLRLHSFDTPFGLMRTASLGDCLAFVALPTMKHADFRQIITRTFPNFEADEGGKVNRETEKQILAYFAGKLKKFDLDLEWYGTPFQRAVLNQVAAIPYGKTKSYGEIARIVGSPGATRAVGTVNARNRLPLVIPCHRVLAVSGLGGYGGGLDMKKKLLILEGALESELLSLL
jgi:methylated-DNA-[protein]-cysteine S-methyltransferase